MAVLGLDAGGYRIDEIINKHCCRLIIGASTEITARWRKTVAQLLDQVSISNASEAGMAVPETSVALLLLLQSQFLRVAHR
jgi:hypothetical protein